MTTALAPDLPRPALPLDTRTEDEIIRDAHAVVPPTPPVNVDRVLAAMAEQHQTNAARITAMEKMIEQLARIVTTNAASVPVAAPVPAVAVSPVAGLDQVLAIAKMLRDVAAPAPQTTMKDSMEMMMMMLDMREKIAAGVPRGDGDGSALGAVLPALVGPLAELLSRQSAQTPPAAVAAPAPAPAALPAPAPKPPAPMPPAPTTPVGKLLAALPVWAKMAITAQAEANADVDALADHVLAMLPDAALESFIEVAGNTETAVEEIVTMIPKWVPYRKWLRELLDAIYAKLRRALEESADDASDATDTSDDDTDAESDARA